MVGHMMSIIHRQNDITEIYLHPEDTLLRMVNDRWDEVYAARHYC